MAARYDRELAAAQAAAASALEAERGKRLAAERELAQLREQGAARSGDCAWAPAPDRSHTHEAQVRSPTLQYLLQSFSKQGYVCSHKNLV